MPKFSCLTWNVENLFPPGIDTGNGVMVTSEEYEAKLAYLVERIGAVAPTVIALQEVGHESAVADLAERLDGGFPAWRVSSAPDARGSRVAIMAQVPIGGATEIRSLAAGELGVVPDWAGRPSVTTMGRGALMVDLDVPGQPIRVLTCHLKSKLVTYRGAGGAARFEPNDEAERAIGAGLALVRRTAEAATIRIAIADALASVPEATAPLVVMGDLNDEPRAATSQLFTGPEDSDATRADRGDRWRLYNLTDAVPRQGDASADKWFLPKAERYTRVYQGQRELIDQILVTRSLLGEAGEIRQDQWRVKKVRAMVDSIAREYLAEPSPLTRVGRDRPDHAPVFAKFAW